ncbi:MAG: hypothetical protein L3J25_11695, partial [Flavobacteriaceae bacterium]|nr:hypothetical protein [Flavobacteriaceae bacterium]
NNCSVLEPELSSIGHICYPDLKTIFISNYGTTLVSWQVSSNVTIISSTENSVTISAKFANSSGNGWVKATLSESNIILTEYFEVGVPMVSYITLDSFRSDPIYTDRWTNITARYNGTIDVGQLGYAWEWVVPYSQVRYNGENISYIHVSPIGTPTSIYIKTRASNECGCSDWKGEWFTVEDPPSGCTSCPTRPGEIHY